MRRLLLLVLVVRLLVPMSLAAPLPITRRDGFLLLWRSIARPAEQSREEPFADVTKGDPGFLESTFAKERGILEGAKEQKSSVQFRPDDALELSDALLWLYRTRNVAELPDMEREDLPVLLRRYPVGAFLEMQESEHERVVEETVTGDELVTLMRILDTLLREEVHEVSLYAEDFHGDHTAFGEIFDMNALTAAHRTFPKNTLVRVTNVEDGRSVIVRINDRGPYVEGRDMDLSLGAFTTVAERTRGTMLARFERLGDDTIVRGCRATRRYQQRITRNVRLQRGIPHSLPLGETLVLRANRPFLVREVSYPDGVRARVQDWVHPGEHYAFTPAIIGEYAFVLRTVEGRGRSMRMTVVDC